jgi:hypothetical protein
MIPIKYDVAFLSNIHAKLIPNPITSNANKVGVSSSQSKQKVQLELSWVSCTHANT